MFGLCCSALSVVIAEIASRGNLALKDDDGAWSSLEESSSNTNDCHELTNYTEPTTELYLMVNNGYDMN